MGMLQRANDQPTAETQLPRSYDDRHSAPGKRPWGPLLMSLSPFVDIDGVQFHRYDPRDELAHSDHRKRLTKKKIRQ